MRIQAQAFNLQLEYPDILGVRPRPCSTKRTGQHTIDTLLHPTPSTFDSTKIFSLTPDHLISLVQYNVLRAALAIYPQCPSSTPFPMNAPTPSPTPVTVPEPPGTIPPPLLPTEIQRLRLMIIGLISFPWDKCETF